MNFVNIMLFKDCSDWTDRTMIGLLWLVIFGVMGSAYAIYYEATFDYSVCETTDIYEPRHRAMWVQQMPMTCSNNICSGGGTIIHPARDWTVRLYNCPEDGGRLFQKWREEAKI